MTQLLATLDGSPASEEILPVAAALALGLGARLTLLTVVRYPSGTHAPDVSVSEVNADSPLAGPSPEQVGVVLNLSEPATVGLNRSEPAAVEIHGQAIARAKDEGLDYLTRVTEGVRVRGVDLNLEVAIGDDPAKAIIESAHRNQVEYIAMCTHGRSGLNRLLHGSVTTAVLNLSGIPVLLVRPKG